MKDDEIFWAQVQRALDERRDPMLDEGVQDLIAEQPERFRELQSMLDALRELPKPARRRPIVRIALAAAASIAAVTCALWFTHRSDVTPNSPPALRGRVISFEWEVGRETPTRSTSITLDDRGLTAKAEYRDAPTPRTTWTTESTHPKYP